MLPLDIQNFYDAEDMISDAVLHVWRVREKYDSSKAKESTWIQHITDNFCISKLAHYSTLQFSACTTVSLDSVLSVDTDSSVLSKYDDASRYRCSQTTQEVREAKDAVEKVIEFGSDTIKDFLDRLFNGRELTEIPHFSLRKLAEQHKVNCRDFELVYRLAIP